MNCSANLFLSKIVALPIIAAANGFAPGNAEGFARGDGVSAAGDGTGAGALKGEGCPGNTGREGGAIPMGNGDCIPAAAIPNIAAAAAEVGTHHGVVVVLVQRPRVLLTYWVILMLRSGWVCL